MSPINNTKKVSKACQWQSLVRQNIPIHSRLFSTVKVAGDITYAS
jgi:hypothetical protein